jgi:predicted ATP-binding protein involved in virulence
MEDKELEKYIFDPKNPKGCRVYKLLLEILKKQNSAVFFSPLYLFTVFPETFFTKEMEKQLWEKPENFDKLSTYGKIDIYVSNFSKAEYFEEIIKHLPPQAGRKGPFINTKKFDKMFKFYLNPQISTNTIFDDIDYIGWHPTPNLELGNSLINNVISSFIESPFSWFEKMDYSNIEIPFNIITFLDSGGFSIIETFNPKYSSIIITTFENFKENLISGTNFKPLLLKDINDVYYLLDVLERDLAQERAKEQFKEEPIEDVKNIIIKDFFSLKDISLKNLEKEKEIYFVGENGDGKTTLLQAITLALKGNENEGLIINFLKENPYNNLRLSAEDGKNNKYSFASTEKSYKNLFAYGVNRNGVERNKNNLRRDEERSYLTLFFDNQYLKNPEDWLVYLDHKLAREEKDGISLETAKDILKSILSNNIEINVTTSGVIFKERGTELKFEQLSQGYKSVIIWVSDLIIRLSENQPYVLQTEDYRGIVLVDEIEAHLHPKWKYRIVSDLRRWFPKIQFFFTTHSPTVILGASKDAVFYKVYKEDGITKISEPIKNVSNLTANSLITSPLFGLEVATAKSASETDKKNVSSDDYIYQKIHEVIAKKISENPGLVDADVMKMIEDELAKLEK